jgi:putative transposase
MVVNVVRGFEYKLLPNDEQKNYFHQAFGCARKMWNELLQDTQNGVKRSIPDIKRTFTYMYDVDSTAFTSLWKEFMKTLKPSKRWYKQKQEITKLYTKLRNTRKDFLHKESRRLTNHFDLIYVEDLDLKSMGEKPEYNPNEPIDKHESAITKARRKAMFRTGYHQFLTYLEYKMVDAGKELVKVNRWYKSTKKCFMCGNEKDMPTHIRSYECECGHVMNRDINAANNLIKEGLRLEVYKEYPKLNTYHWISN